MSYEASLFLSNSYYREDLGFSGTIVAAIENRATKHSPIKHGNRYAVSLKFLFAVEYGTAQYGTPTTSLLQEEIRCPFLQLTHDAD
jgi:hypothetical protein